MWQHELKAILALKSPTKFKTELLTDFVSLSLIAIFFLNHFMFIELYNELSFVLIDVVIIVDQY